MELLLVVSRTGRPPVDLRVDIDAAAPAAELSGPPPAPASSTRR